MQAHPVKHRISCFMVQLLYLAFQLRIAKHGIEGTYQTEGGKMKRNRCGYCIDFKYILGLIDE